jgi:hypothetical protein
MRKGERRMKKQFIFILILIILDLVNAGTWTKIDYPESYSTAIYGVQGDKIVGTYQPEFGGLRGFTFDGTNWETFNHPDALQSSVTAIDGSNIAGGCSISNHTYGFIYNGVNWKLLYYPGSRDTSVFGLSGNLVIGSYRISIPDQPYIRDVPYIYDLENDTWTNFTKPGVTSLWMEGINGNKILGSYYSNQKKYNYIYEITSDTWTIIPNFPNSLTCQINEISGDKIVGLYADQENVYHGFLYDGVNWTTLDFPDSTSTWINGIDGDMVVGQYWDEIGHAHGFIYTIPEPMTFLFFGFGVILLQKRK